MRRWAVALFLVMSLTVIACSSDKDALDHVTGELPPTIPTTAYTAVEREGEGARLFEVVGVRWPDRCLGVYRQGYACLAEEVPGFRVLVEKRGWLIEYHTGLQGGVLRAGFAGRVQDHPAAANR